MGAYKHRGSQRCVRRVFFIDEKKSVRSQPTPNGLNKIEITAVPPVEGMDSFTKKSHPSFYRDGLVSNRPHKNYFTV